MGLTPLQIAAAELVLKDLASKSAKKIEKSVDRTSKSLGKAEKLTKKTDKTLKKLSKSFDKVRQSSVKAGNAAQRSFQKIRKSERVQRVGSRVRRGAGRGAGIAGRVAGGGGLGGAFGAVPLVGGILAGIFAALQVSKGRFVAAVTLKKELKKLREDFKTEFNISAKRVKALGKGFFRTRDIQAAFVNLTDAGINALDIEKAAPDLQRFAKSQGFASLQQGLEALTSGSIRAGKGLSTIDIKRIQALAPFTKDVATSQIAFQQIADILKSNSVTMGKFSKLTQKNLGSLQKTFNAIESIEETSIKRASTGKKAFIAFKTAIKLQRSGQDAAAKVASEAAPIVRVGIEKLESGLKDVAGLFESEEEASKRRGRSIKKSSDEAEKEARRQLKKERQNIKNRFKRTKLPPLAPPPRRFQSAIENGESITNDNRVNQISNNIIQTQQKPVDVRITQLGRQNSTENINQLFNKTNLNKTPIESREIRNIEKEKISSVSSALDKSSKVNNNQKVNMNNTININITSTGNDNLPDNIALKVQEALNQLSRTAFRFNTGLSLS